MTILKYIKILFLSLYWQIPQAKEVDFKGQTEVVRDLNRKKEKRKRLKKKKQKLPAIQKKLPGHHRFRTTRPKDHRFSDQRRIRRMYRNS